MTIREALLAMGYSEVMSGRWLKPIGFQMFGFLELTNTWTNYFKDVHGPVCVWESHTMTEADLTRPLSKIKEYEAYSRTDIQCGNQESQFQLKAIDL